MSTASHLEMHRENTRWRTEDDLWRECVACWEREACRAADDLPNLEEALHKHLDLLRHHAASIRLYGREAAAHEHALAEYESGSPGEHLVELTKAHQREAERREARREEHERMKQAHHELMAKWNMLVKALDAAR